MDLLVDSNLAHMFGPEGATLYFARLLKVDVRSLRPTMSQEWPHAFFITNPTTPAVQNAPPTLHINRLPAWLLDYAIRQVGTVVPQRIWPPGNMSETPRPANASLNMPIFFVGRDRVTLGLPLPVAISGDDRVQLLGAGSPAPIGHGSTMYIRITVSCFFFTTTSIPLLRWGRGVFFSFSVARLHRLDYADNDQGPDTSTQHDIPREIRKETRECSGQVHGSKSHFFPFPFRGFPTSHKSILTPTNSFFSPPPCNCCTIVCYMYSNYRRPISFPANSTL